MLSVEERNALVLKNIKLAYFIAGKYQRCDWCRQIGTEEDIAQEAIKGLILAAGRADPNHPSLSAFLGKSIHGYLLSRSKEIGTLVHVPPNMYHKPKKPGRALATYLKYEREAEIARKPSLHHDMQAQYQSRAPYTVWTDFPEKPLLTEEQQVEEKDLRIFVKRNLLRKLPKKLKMVIEMVYGLNKERKCYTFTEIGKKLKVSKTTAATWKRAALNLLRELQSTQSLEALV